jgi:hypothetical protein
MVPISKTGLRLEALTVSVNYADYLRCIVENAQQVDRWLIVTHEDDVETIALCESYGLEYHLSKRLYENNAAFHKAAALNEGLALLSPDSWRIVLDSDILLPVDFRERLECLSLNEDCLYGVSGRIVCETVEEFKIRRMLQPWHGAADMAPFVIGYFQMFHALFPWQSFPEKADDASTYDVLFCRQVPAARQKRLPFTVLHAGPSGQNWRGRESLPFFQAGAEKLDSKKLDLRKEITALGYKNPDLAIVGNGSFKLLEEVAGVCRSVTYFDHAGILTGHIDPLWNESRSWWRGQLEKLRLPDNVSIVPTHEEGEMDEVFDIVAFLVEVDYDFLLMTLPGWIPRLKPDSTVCGLGYFERAPDTCIPVNLLFGSSRIAACDSGFWSVTVENPRQFLTRIMPPPVQGERGVVYIYEHASQLENLMVSISSLRRHWKGPVAVLHISPEDPSVRIACARLGVECIALPSRLKANDDELESDALGAADFQEALCWVPWQTAVFMACETYVCAPLDALFEEVEDSREGLVKLPLQDSATSGLTGICFGFVRERLIRDSPACPVSSDGEGNVPSDSAPFALSRRVAAGTRLDNIRSGTVVVDFGAHGPEDSNPITETRRELERFFRMG